MMPHETAGSVPARNRVWELFRALRPHQWAKNALVFLSAFAAHRALTGQLALTLIVGFVAFSATASAVYLINDIVDLSDDRAHPRKRDRPLASGSITTPMALVGAAILLAAAVALCLTTRPEFAAVLGGYFLLTTAYSFFLKRRQTVDIVVLALLYTARVIAGAALIDAPLSRWFLAFCVFLFLSLAAAKRVIEMGDGESPGGNRLAGRGYLAADRPVLVALGTSATAVSALVYCLYITSSDVLVLYRRPDLLWAGLPLLLYWQARVWILANRGTMHDDPVVFALRDRTSYVVAFLVALVVRIAT